MTAAALQVPASSLRKMLVPLALAQFICSFAGSKHERHDQRHQR
jgi:hypothetical protein